MHYAYVLQSLSNPHASCVRRFDHRTAGEFKDSHGLFSCNACELVEKLIETQTRFQVLKCSV